MAQLTLPAALAIRYHCTQIFVSIWPCPAAQVQRGLCVKCTWAEDLGLKAYRKGRA